MEGYTLLFGVLFGAVGLGYFIYGKKQQKGVPLLCGFLLMGFPYLVSNIAAVIAIGAVLMALPFIIRA